MDEAADIGSHIGLKRLIAYRQGTLPAAEREALQEHLSLCRRCTDRLRELRDFETASARGDAAGPEALREEAWGSLSRHLPTNESKIRPIAGAGRRQTPVLRAPRFLYGAAAALLLALLGLSLWTAVTVQRERERSARLEQRLKDREAALAEAEQQLAASRARPEPEPGRVRDLEAKIAELTAEVEGLRRTTPVPSRNDQLARLPEIEVSTAPRFVLRGQEPGTGMLRGGGAVNPVQTSEEGRLTVALSLADHPVSSEYRFELIDRAGEVLWAGRRPGKKILGDAGTTVSVSGLAPGRYRLRVEGLQPDRTELIGEYLLDVAPR